MRRFDTVLFDLDGTLLDTLEDICGAANHTLRELGYPERTLAEMRRFVGNGAEMQAPSAQTRTRRPSRRRSRFTSLTTPRIARSRRSPTRAFWS